MARKIESLKIQNKKYAFSRSPECSGQAFAPQSKISLNFNQTHERIHLIILHASPCAGSPDSRDPAAVA
jgi:hypothetical protein